MQLDQILKNLKGRPEFMQNVTHWQTNPARPPQYAPAPGGISPQILAVLRGRGIERLYTHQAEAVEHVLRGENVVVVTPTASGKTLCYNLPVLSAILQNPDARALYLFPTKALASDQAAELYRMVTDLGADIKAYTYDGDTPANARRAVRQAGHIVVTNPDMLHSGILPHHTKWVKLFENLEYVVIDELHSYRGVFGSHMANVLRRLRRLCAFYGSHPRFICCSATIANPKELAEALTESPMTLVDRNGAPMGEKHIVFYNPPVVNVPLGIRRSSLLETRDIARELVENDVQTIVFARSRLAVEVLTTYLKSLKPDPLGGSRTVRGYRGGYLPSLRHEIERGLRDASIRCVVSTNALELGVDIGALEACVLCGYPGTIASTWQQAGRAGRRNSVSLTVLVATSSPVDQYMVGHPEYFFTRSPEHARIDANNLYILLDHLKCAGYELPFTRGEGFGDVPPEQAEELLTYLSGEQVLRPVGEKWFWQSEEYPASDISIRGTGEENFLIIDITRATRHEVIGEMDRYTVPMLLHENAIYMHEGQQYQVERLDYDDHKAYIRHVDVGYYTDADLNVSLKVLDLFDSHDEPFPRAKGEVSVTTLVSMFKKMHMYTHENLGSGPVELPETSLHTTACWLSLPPAATQGRRNDEVAAGLLGISSVVGQIAPVYLMCGMWDIRAVPLIKDPFTHLPTLYLYDTIPGGVGLSEHAYTLLPELIRRAGELIEHCPCEDGCPSCVGPALESGGKRIALELIRALRGAGTGTGSGSASRRIL